MVPILPPVTASKKSLPVYESLLTVLKIVRIFSIGVSGNTSCDGAKIIPPLFPHKLITFFKYP